MFPAARASPWLSAMPKKRLRVLLVLAVAVQAAHLAVLTLLADAERASNVIQLVAPALCAALCMSQAWQSKVKHQSRLWLQLSSSFLLWTAAQMFYLSTLFSPAKGDAGLISDLLWLAFAFPVLLVAAHPSRSLKSDPVGWLDTAQSCLLFCILFWLIYPHPGILKPPLAYHVENLAMVLAVALRYSVSQTGEERAFYRSILVFTVVYGLTSAVAMLLHGFGAPRGTLIDLNWSVPFTAFTVSVVSDRMRIPRLEDWNTRWRGFPTHVHGVSALGMAVMSLAGAATLARDSLLAGILALLASTMLFVLRTSTREWQLHAAYGRLHHAALHDPLTGLANRALLRMELTSRLERQERMEDRIAEWAESGPGDLPGRTGLLFIDLDRFKTINDGLGHAFGDLLLIRTAELLRAAVRSQDIVARHGGDEFVILLEQVTEEEAEALAAKVIEFLRAPLTIEGRLIHVTASVGIVLSQEGASADSLLQDADCAMYKAKSEGRDRGKLFVPSMLEAAKHELELETELRKALAGRWIEAHYQPIYRLDEMAVQGFEALARWQHPKWGMVAPDEFIPLAEDTGLIIELGRQVLRRACRDCAGWNQRFGRRLQVAVNVSAHQLAYPYLIEEISEILEDAGLEPSLLKLEVTESVLLQDYHAAEAVLSKARGLGMEVCLDDFGTGYSSLSYLLSFPFDVVKIDRSFVSHLDRDAGRAEVVRMVIGLAATLNKRIIAEGVESQAELARLREFGCDMIQGFVLSRPLVPAAIEVLLRGQAVTEGSVAKAAETLVGWLDGSLSTASLPAPQGENQGLPQLGSAWVR